MEWPNRLNALASNALHTYKLWSLLDDWCSCGFESHSHSYYWPEKTLEVIAHNGVISPKVFKLSSKVLFAMYSA